MLTQVATLPDLLTPAGALPSQVRHLKGQDFPVLSLVDYGEILERIRGSAGSFLQISAPDGLLVYPSGQFDTAPTINHIVKLFESGHTVVLNYISSYWENGFSFLKALGTSTECRTEASAFLTPLGNPGFAAHFDSVDVLILQMEGKKIWTVSDPIVPNPVESMKRNIINEDRRATEQQFELMKGDALFIPRGHVHSGVCADMVGSLHVTIGFIHPTRADVLKHQLDQIAFDDSSLRQSVRLGEIANIEPIIIEGDVRALAEPFIKKLLGGNRPTHKYAFSTDKFVRLDKNTKLVRVPYCEYQIVNSDNNLRVYFSAIDGVKNVEFTKSYSVFVHALFGRGETYRISELPVGGSMDEKFSWARALLKTRACIVSHQS